MIAVNEPPSTTSKPFSMMINPPARRVASPVAVTTKPLAVIVLHAMPSFGGCGGTGGLDCETVYSTVDISAPGEAVKLLGIGKELRMDLFDCHFAAQFAVAGTVDRSEITGSDR